MSATSCVEAAAHAEINSSSTGNWRVSEALHLATGEGGRERLEGTLNLSPGYYSQSGVRRSALSQELVSNLLAGVVCFVVADGGSRCCESCARVVREEQDDSCVLQRHPSLDPPRAIRTVCVRSAARSDRPRAAPARAVHQRLAFCVLWSQYYDQQSHAATSGLSWSPSGL